MADNSFYLTVLTCLKNIKSAEGLKLYLELASGTADGFGSADAVFIHTDSDARAALTFE